MKIIGYLLLIIGMYGTMANLMLVLAGWSDPLSSTSTWGIMGNLIPALGKGSVKQHLPGLAIFAIVTIIGLSMARPGKNKIPMDSKQEGEDKGDLGPG